MTFFCVNPQELTERLQRQAHAYTEKVDQLEEKCQVTDRRPCNVMGGWVNRHIISIVHC